MSSLAAVNSGRSREFGGLPLGLCGGDDAMAARGELNGGIAAEAASGAGDEYSLDMGFSFVIMPRGLEHGVLACVRCFEGVLRCLRHDRHPMPRRRPNEGTTRSTRNPC